MQFSRFVSIMYCERFERWHLCVFYYVLCEVGKMAFGQKLRIVSRRMFYIFTNNECFDYVL